MRYAPRLQTKSKLLASMFTPLRLHLQSGKETLIRTISVETSSGGRFIVRVLNAREYPSTYAGTRPSGAGNFDTHLFDTEQEAINCATKLVHESQAQGYVLRLG
jgi:hypothetical protein